MALSYLRSITSIEIPSSVKTVGQWVFNGCSNLATVTFAAGSRLTALSKYMFQDCTSLETITIPSSVTTIGYQPFKGCTALERVDFVVTDGWYVANSSSATEGDAIDIAAGAVLYLTDTYVNMYILRPTE